MNFRRIIACMTASVLLCTAAASCRKKDKSSKAIIPPSNNSDEVSVAAQSGDAYISIIDGEYYIQYLGKNNDPAHNMLSYNAGVAHIEGNGDYKVSLTTNTKGFRRETAGDENDSSVVPEGLSFMALMLKDGEKLFPDAVLTIKSIKVNGKTVSMKAKAYTSSDDGRDTRANLFNEWTGGVLPKDARCVQGRIVDAAGKAADYASEYAPIVVDAADFAQWSDVEVEFTVSGIK